MIGQIPEPQVSGRTMPSDFAVGADASDNVMFIALVLGYRSDVEPLRDKTCKECNLREIHMRRISRPTRNKVVEAVSRFSTRSVHMYCFTVDRLRHARTLDSAPKTRYFSSTQKSQYIDYCIAMEIKDGVSSSLEMFNQNWSNIMVEVDEDTKKMFKRIGRPVTAPNSAHELADAVAWANHAKSRIGQIKEIDITSNVDRRLRRRFKL